MTLKLARLSWISALSAPSDCRLLMFRRLTHGPVMRVTRNTPIAGPSAARPRRTLRATRKIVAPAIMNRLAASCTRLCAKNWFSLSVSLLILEMRSPALFWLKKSSGRCCSFVKSVLRSANSTRRPTLPIVWVCT